MKSLLLKINEILNITIFQMTFDGIEYNMTLWHIVLDVIILSYFFRLFYGIYRGDR